MKIDYRTEILKAFRIFVWWSIYIINSVDKTKFLYTTSPSMQHHSFFRNYPLPNIIEEPNSTAPCLQRYILFKEYDYISATLDIWTRHPVTKHYLVDIALLLPIR